MTRRGGDASQRTLYALYDKDEQLIFTGDIDELIQYTGCLRSTIHVAVNKGKKLVIKHMIVKKGNLYSLYDKDEQLIFTGTIDQIVGRTGCSRSSIYNVINEGRKLSVKHTIKKVGYEPITEKRCYRCGKILPVEKMIHHHRHSDGKYVPRTICKECKREESREYQRRMRNLKKRSKKNIYYIYEGDKLIVSGTSKEVTNTLFISPKTLYNCVTSKRKILGMYRVERIKGE